MALSAQMMVTRWMPSTARTAICSGAGAGPTPGRGTVAHAEAEIRGRRRARQGIEVDHDAVDPLAVAGVIQEAGGLARQQRHFVEAVAIDEVLVVNAAGNRRKKGRQYLLLGGIENSVPRCVW